MNKKKQKKCSIVSYDLGFNFRTQFPNSKEYARWKNKNNDK